MVFPPPSLRHRLVRWSSDWLAMKASLYLTTLSVLLSVHSGDTVTVHWGEHAFLLCRYNKEEGFSLRDNYFSWQLGKMMVYLFEGGKSKEKDIDGEYKGRVTTIGTVERGNLSLQITNVTPNDEGVYTCHIFTKVPEQTKTDECSIRLQVTANYSTPSIVGPLSGDASPGDVVNLTCLSSGGYPQPVVNWTDGESRPLVNVSSEDEMGQDQGSKLWNVSSVIEVMVTPNSSFICTVRNPRTGEIRRSSPWRAQAPTCPPPPTSVAQHTSTVVSVAVPCVLLTCLAVIVLALWLQSRRRYPGVPSRDPPRDQTVSHVEMELV
ncbi:CD276 antigen-like isoform X2 [Pristis pectinata]|uniref:CD276 antigen-like isoform X2 n=2 Tax=Pristis pectinata TaxID=685728 RepID=UPI00223E562B|nr:CD276 antigen-like isoform X2 [Pristis pectinata]